MTSSDNVHHLTFEDKEILLIGTAHVSKESADLVGQVIERERPDTVCVELCNSRYQSLIQKKKWQDTNLFKVIKEKKAFLLLSNLMLAYFQKKIGQKLGSNVNTKEKMAGYQPFQGNQGEEGLSLAVKSHACIFPEKNRSETREQTRGRNDASHPGGRGSGGQHTSHRQGHSHHPVKNLAVDGAMDKNKAVSPVHHFGRGVGCHNPGRYRENEKQGCP
jgi:hypothetical protein